MKLFISLLIPLAVGITAGLFTRPEIDSWFITLNKPWFNPPNWLFGPVWTTLYILMGIALWIVWKSDAAEPVKKMAIYLFAIQLVLNFFWSLIFFNQHQLGWAFAELVLLWLFILATIFAFGRISPMAAWLMVPYISWVSFAGILNFTIWRLN